MKDTLTKSPAVAVTSLDPTGVTVGAEELEVRAANPKDPRGSAHEH